MKVVITGGTGFLGQRLAARILEQGGDPAPRELDDLTRHIP